MAIDLEALPAARGIYRIYRGRVSYIGLSDNIRQRLRQHLNNSACRSSIIIDIGRAKVSVLELLPKSSDRQLALREWYWFERFRQRGHILVNDPKTLGRTPSGQYYPRNESKRVSKRGAGMSAPATERTWPWSLGYVGVAIACFSAGFLGVKRIKQTLPSIADVPETPAVVVLDEGDRAETARFICNKLLRRGSRGESVATLQNRLQTLGYLKDRPDGIYGLGTQEAVEAFQSDRGLVADGVAGCRTQSALHDSSTTLYYDTPTAVTSDGG
ncbi:putative peptidoglycan-binding domain-containing protein [Rubidibacter lacunae KORDI 51-2]|uniref:Putative peptidoglycan-binding domain-containing protein n=1 Tax=Rubidibacter lacunae KORDI 51-2 TaxID=582515 RepID=U5DM07_9CHRO|nr:peptidoglycan-binding protein [Rubidibacter lacunae]ERN40750.1 putative peptidoglycan-binding domain-containing protein [Rubidibacter lacunae KORDI 51-2]